MALNTFKCNRLIPMHFKGLIRYSGRSGGSEALTPQSVGLKRSIRGPTVVANCCHVFFSLDIKTLF